MLRASSAEFQWLVNVSSSSHHTSEIQFDDLKLVKEGAYRQGVAYGQSKLAQIHMADYVERLYGMKGLHGLSITLGGAFTNLQKYISPEVKKDCAETGSSIMPGMSGVKDFAYDEGKEASEDSGGGIVLFLGSVTETVLWRFVSYYLINSNF